MKRENRVVRRVRRVCLALPETNETQSWGHPNFRAGKRTFATVEWIKGRPSIAFRMNSADVDLLLRRKDFFTTPYGQGRWVSVWADRPLNWRFAQRMLERSYRLVALKRMIAALERMKKRSAFVVASTALLTTALAVAQVPQLGYDDTPFQPDGKWRVHDSRRPRPPVVTPGPFVAVAPPSDATVLLGNGADLSQWQADDGSPATWPMADGVLQTGKGMLRTKTEFTDVQLHVEFATPAQVIGESQGRGNSGVFLAGVFEVQVLDSFHNPTYADGQAAALYGQHPPLVNASRGPGEWQTYDIVFTAPRFSASNQMASPAIATVFHNGVLVHNARTFWGPTAHRRIEPYVPSNARGPIRLQDHGNPVKYRNIWVRALSGHD